MEALPQNGVVMTGILVTVGMALGILFLIYIPEIEEWMRTKLGK